MMNAISVSAISLVCVTSCGGRVPTDAELRTHFMNHQAEFDSVGALAAADSQLVVILNYGGSADVYVHEGGFYDRRVHDEELKGSRRSPYRRLVKRVGAERVRRSKDGSVWCVWTVNGRASTGFAYSPEPPGLILRSLDDVGRSETSTSGYVQVAPGWYAWISYRTD